jgi:hypothetical protein
VNPTGASLFYPVVTNDESTVSYITVICNQWSTNHVAKMKRSMVLVRGLFRVGCEGRPGGFLRRNANILEELKKRNNQYTFK